MPWSTTKEKRPAGHIEVRTLYTRLGVSTDRKKKRRGRGGRRGESMP